MTPLLVNFDPLLELVYSWPLYEVIFNYLFLSVHINKIVIFKYNWNFLDQLLLPYKSYDRGMLGIYFFIFASCEPLISLIWPVN